MFNNFLTNKIVPWQEHGRWYKLTAIIEKVGSSYAWAVDTDNSDPIFDDPNGFAIGTTSTTTIPLINSTGVTHYIIDIHRGAIKSTVTGTLISATQSASASVAAYFPDNSTVYVYPGITANATQYGYNTTIEIWLFIN